MSKLKRIASLTAAITLTASSLVPSFAATPRYETVCGSRPYHVMRSHWLGTAYVNGETYIGHGCAWQCENCNYVMVTEGDVTLDPGVAVGKWAGYACSYKLGPLEQVYMNAEEWGADYNSNTLPGFRFFNSNWR